MFIPGGNLLNLAMSVVATQDIELIRFTGRTLNEIGIWENQYAAPVTVRASVQAINLNVYKQFGLDWQKNYFQVYVNLDVVPLERDHAGDRVRYNGKLFQATSDVPWQSIDGWDSFVMVEITPDQQPIGAG